MIKDTNADLDLDILAEDFQKMNGADHTAGFGFFADFPLDTIRLRDIRLGWVILRNTCARFSAHAAKGILQRNTG